jgi:hypothetical protein
LADLSRVAAGLRPPNLSNLLFYRFLLTSQRCVAAAGRAYVENRKYLPAIAPFAKPALRFLILVKFRGSA